MTEHDLRWILPPHHPERLWVMEDSLVRHGCLAPLVVWRETGLLLDGYLRRSICDAKGIPYDTAFVSLAGEAEACAFRSNLHLGARSMSEYDAHALGQEHAGWSVGERGSKSWQVRELHNAWCLNELPQKTKQALSAGEMSISAAYRALQKRRATLLRGIVARATK